MLSPGIIPVRFINRTMKKMEVMSGKNRLPSFFPRMSSAMFTRTSSSPISTRLWKRPGIRLMRRVPSQKMRTIAMTAIKRINTMRFISKSVPAKKTASGKNSAIEGALNSSPPVVSSAAKDRSGVTARCSSANSRFGACNHAAKKKGGRSLKAYQENRPTPNPLRGCRGAVVFRVTGERNITHVRHAGA
jgi:hypothetical protein